MQSLTAEVNRKEAHRIVSLLARGVDPDNPELALLVDVLERPNTIRALFLAAEALNQDTLADKTAKDSRVGKPWSKAEDDELLFEVSQNYTLGEIASSHQRSHGSIIARMAHLGIVEDRNAARAFFRR